MDSTQIIQTVLGELHDKLGLLKDMVRRDAKFPQAPSKIKVAIGMRRSGKTYFLYQKILKLLEEGIDKTSILYKF
jgi:predicted AAA+ superfamily ATPase